MLLTEFIDRLLMMGILAGIMTNILLFSLAFGMSASVDIKNFKSQLRNKKVSESSFLTYIILCNVLWLTTNFGINLGHCDRDYSTIIFYALHWIRRCQVIQSLWFYSNNIACNNKLTRWNLFKLVVQYCEFSHIFF